jgi:hypothetical protein
MTRSAIVNVINSIRSLQLLDLRLRGNEREGAGGRFGEAATSVKKGGESAQDMSL